jgi:hydroxymethylglutaryl-CoA reductase (NADPH)
MPQREELERIPIPEMPDAGLGRGSDEASARCRLAAAGADEQVIQELLDEGTRVRLSAYDRVIEQFIGTAKIPVGLVGPLLIRGFHARGSFWVPLATSEAALIGSYTRGARTISRSGGATTLILGESVARCPCFIFDRVADAGHFVMWLAGAFESVKGAAEATTAHGCLDDLRFTFEGNHVYVAFEYSTRDACGQNMSAVATEAACRWILRHSPIAPLRWYLEANHSGDKKASAQSYCLIRGRKVTADVVIPPDILQEELLCSVADMCEYWRVSALGGVLSGTLGVHGHFANGLAGLYIACGQDAACVAESAVGVTRMEPRPNGDLYAAVTLPSVMVGTVGGGTALPSARACLRLLGVEGEGGATVLAEVAAALLLAGELSLVAAIASNSYGRAHRVLRRSSGRSRPAREDQEPPPARADE